METTENCPTSIWCDEWYSANFADSGAQKIRLYSAAVRSERTNIIWAALGRVTHWDMADSEIINLNFSQSCENKEVKIILVALTTHIIWKERNRTKHNPGSRITNQFGLVRQIWAKLKGRLNYEQRNPNTPLTGQLRELVEKFNNFFSSAGTVLPP